MTQDELYEQLCKRVYEIIYPEGYPLEGHVYFYHDGNPASKLEQIPCMPLQLQDYLRAINKKGFDNVDQNVTISSDGYINEVFENYYVVYLCDINLEKPLSKQTPATLKQLINILKLYNN